MHVIIAEATSLKKARRTLDELAIAGGFTPINTDEESVVYSNGITRMYVRKLGIRLYQIIKEKEK